jgi:hypothetical protein
MAGVLKRSFALPDDVTQYPKVRIETVRVGSFDVKRVTAEPGWRWSESIGPASGKKTCPLEHLVWIVIQGRFAVRMEDGVTEEFGPGDVGRIDHGHDAWVVGDEAVVGIDVQTASEK